MNMYSKKIIFLLLVLMSHSSFLYAVNFDCERMLGDEMPMEQSACHDMESNGEPLPLSECTDCKYSGCTSMSSVTVNRFIVSYASFHDLVNTNKDQYFLFLQHKIYHPPKV
jgi:hypothetical protein